MPCGTEPSRAGRSGLQAAEAQRDGGGGGGAARTRTERSGQILSLRTSAKCKCWGGGGRGGGEVRFPVLWQAEVRGEGKEEEKGRGGRRE